MIYWQNTLSWVIGALLVVVVSVIWIDWRQANDSMNLEKFRFQQAIGGVGLGSVTVPAWNFRDYDPRLQQVAQDVLYPIPGGYSYSPDRLSMVFTFTESAKQ
jgi:hypothetical protein